MKEEYAHASIFKRAVRYGPLRQTLWQVLTLLALALLLAVSTNHWRSDGIPLIRDLFFWTVSIYLTLSTYNLPMSFKKEK